MAILSDQWDKISSYARTLLISMLDPSVATPVPINVVAAHKGFYIIIVDNEGKQLVKEGFLAENIFNISESSAKVINGIHNKAKLTNIPLSQLKSSSFYFYLINNINYIANPTLWDEAKDGLFFMWGQDFKSILLPYEIKKIGGSKINVLDTLCSQCNLPSSLYKLPEGLVWRIDCDEHKS